MEKMREKKEKETKKKKMQRRKKKKQRTTRIKQKQSKIIDHKEEDEDLSGYSSDKSRLEPEERSYSIKKNVWDEINPHVDEKSLMVKVFRIICKDSKYKPHFFIGKIVH